MDCGVRVCVCVRVSAVHYKPPEQRLQRQRQEKQIKIDNYQEN